MQIIQQPPIIEKKIYCLASGKAFISMVCSSFKPGGSGGIEMTGSAGGAWDIPICEDEILRERPGCPIEPFCIKGEE